METKTVALEKLTPVLPILVAGCASLSAGGENVELTGSVDAVKACTLLGAVSADPPFGVPDDWKIKLRNQTAQLGGSRVYSAGPGVGSVPGMAYLCPPPK